jgi:tetratricopeptide (TPR) repeat protein
VWVDVAAFAELRQGEARSEPLTAARLEEVVSLVRGAFLEDLSLADSAAFEEWAVVSRERLGRQILATLHNLTRAYEGLGEYERALYHAWHWVDLEPWDEGAQRQVMRLLALTGQRAAALAQYEACRCAQAASLLDEAIAAYQETAGLAARAKLYAVAASARGLLGCYDEARTLAHASLALARECGSRREAGICCLVLGFGATVERSFAAAQEWFEESAALLQGVGMQDVLGSTLAAWGYAARGLGQHARSWQLMAQALRMRSGGPFLGSVLVALPGIALLLLDRGEAERAAELCALAWRYPFVSRSPLFEDLAGREIAAAAIRLPPERVLAARSRGRARDLDATLSDLASETGF